MLNIKVKEFLEEKGFGDRLTEHAETIDTVEHAAQQMMAASQEHVGDMVMALDDGAQDAFEAAVGQQPLHLLKFIHDD